jgi:hypothetical protein
LKHFLRSTEPFPGGAILPPKGKTVTFTQDEETGDFVSEPIDAETAGEVNGIGPFTAFHEDDGLLPPEPAAGTTVKAPAPTTGADGKPADTNLEGGDPDGLRELAAAGEKARQEATQKAEDEQKAKEAGEKADAKAREELDLPEKPAAPETVPDGKGGTVTLNEPEKPAEAGGTKIEGLPAEATDTAGSRDQEQSAVEAGAKTDNATLGVVTSADAGIPTDEARAKGETPLTPPGPTPASATPKNPLPGYTIDEVKSPDMTKKAPNSEPGKATGKAAAKAQAAQSGTGADAAKATQG